MIASCSKVVFHGVKYDLKKNHSSGAKGDYQTVVQRVVLIEQRHFESKAL